MTNGGDKGYHDEKREERKTAVSTPRKPRAGSPSKPQSAAKPRAK